MLSLSLSLENVPPPLLSLLSATLLPSHHQTPFLLLLFPLTFKVTVELSSHA
ncbi:uncharacterized protein DS421_16g551470 [Arachis hypogaea]|nr:uncharacterized protein DS421_16g551470 [Arachis hypogaea]